MKAKKQKSQLAIRQGEDPIEHLRRVRAAILERFDNDVYKYGAYLREKEKEHQDRLVDVEKLRKLGIISTKKIP
ncbi:MAG: hypothetical protein HY390_03760 [Deltaproteobacteria bacterium]|nr:hypothetical protein [Deltaproteobacteria bacterium]